MGVTLIPDADADLPDSRSSFLKAWNPVTQKEAWNIELPGDWPGGILATGNAAFRTDYALPRRICVFRQLS